MAVGTVSGVNLDEAWQLIATNTPSAAATSTFSSLSGYKKFLIAYKSITSSTATVLGLRFNGDSTVGNYGGSVWHYGNIIDNNTQASLITATGGTTHYSGAVTIDNSVQGFHLVTVNSGYNVTLGSSVYLPTTAADITSIEFRPASGGTITGTIYLYGIAA
jgi:hypothetical protein